MNVERSNHPLSTRDSCDPWTLGRDVDFPAAALKGKILYAGPNYIRKWTACSSTPAISSCKSQDPHTLVNIRAVRFWMVFPKSYVGSQTWGPKESSQKSKIRVPHLGKIGYTHVWPNFLEGKDSKPSKFAVASPKPRPTSSLAASNRLRRLKQHQHLGWRIISLDILVNSEIEVVYGSSSSRNIGNEWKL